MLFILTASLGGGTPPLFPPTHILQKRKLRLRERKVSHFTQPGGSTSLPTQSGELLFPSQRMHFSPRLVYCVGEGGRTSRQGGLSRAGISSKPGLWAAGTEKLLRLTFKGTWGSLSWDPGNWAGQKPPWTILGFKDLSQEEAGFWLHSETPTLEAVETLSLLKTPNNLPS